MKKIIFIGPLGKGMYPNNGASIKNIILKNRIEKSGYYVKSINTEGWRRNPVKIVSLLWTILTNRKTDIIISASFKSAYLFISYISMFVPPKYITYWVIGGALAENIVKFNFRTQVYKKIRLIIVEGNMMEEALSRIGIKNVKVVPNFKEITYLPQLKEIQTRKIKFVFLSRIVPDKGCDLIIESVENIKQSQPDSEFSVDFYGPIDHDYEKIFLNKISSIKEINYMGFLDLRNSSNYDTLIQYDVLLFPTFWATEGFPAIVIDAFIAGLPIIASDWNMNTEIITEGKTGLIILPKSAESLQSAMREVIDNIDEFRKMRHNCQKRAKQFDADEVINHQSLSNIGFK